MEINLEYALMVLLLVGIVYAFWWLFIRKKKCNTRSDCKSHQVCSGGYCKSKKKCDTRSDCKPHQVCTRGYCKSKGS